MSEAPDWRSASAYAYLNRLDRSGFAWEFLRRNPNYHRDYRTAMRRRDPQEVARWRLRFRGSPLIAGRRGPGDVVGARRSGNRPGRTGAPTFVGARSLSGLARSFERHAADGVYLVVSNHGGSHRIVLVDGGGADHGIVDLELFHEIDGGRADLIRICLHLLMAEMPLSSEDHRYGMMICHADGFIVADRTSWLNDCCDASFGGCLDAISKGEVGIGGQDRTSRTLRGFFYG